MGKLKLFGLHGDHPPGQAISYPGGVGLNFNEIIILF